MVQLLIIFVLSITLIVVLGGWHRDRRLLAESRKGSLDRDAEKTTALEKANEDLKTAQAELQRRWQYLAEAQRLSHSGTFGWKVHSGELVWSDETYRILGFARQMNPTLDLVFDRVHPEDRERLQQIRDRATQNGMDLDIEHRILLPDGAIKYVHVVAHAGRDNAGKLEYVGAVTDITERKYADEEREALSHSLQAGSKRARTRRKPPLGIILCAGKNTEQIELLELGTAGIHVAEYLTVLPPAEVLREKLHQANETARARIEAKAGEQPPRTTK
jgi:PAS domain S-box-containing protein